MIFHSSFEPLALSVTLTFSGFMINPSRLLQLARLCVDVELNHKYVLIDKHVK